MIKINHSIPNHTLEAYHDGEIKKIDLASYDGKWLIIFFYPADFTFVCPTELGELADYYPKLQKINCEIVSVSTDTVFTHKARQQTY